MLFAQEAVKRENESMIVIEPHLIKYLCGGGGNDVDFGVWLQITCHPFRARKQNITTSLIFLNYVNRNTYKITTV